jgi:hypothetical protein
MRSRFSILIACIVFLFSCSSKLSTNSATSVIKSGLRLSEKDKFEIIGISQESQSLALVKFSISEKTLNVRLRKYDNGWKLEEIQNEMGLWIPAATLTNAMDDSTKIRTAQKEISTIATALADYITDKAMPPAISGAYDENSTFYKSLSPMYIKILPVKDPWGNNYLVYCGTTINGHYGITGSASDDFMVVSLGKDGTVEMWEYNPSTPEAGLYTEKDATKDLVNFNGSFIRGLRVGQ